MRVGLHIQDPAMRMTLAIMMKTAGFEVDNDSPRVVIVDTPEAAAKTAPGTPTLVLASASNIADAVQAMQHGAFGYIFVPLQPGEAVLMVERAAGNNPAPQDKEPDRHKQDLASVERRHIEQVLKACKGNRVKAARVLGIGRNTLWRKLKQFGG